MSSRLLTRSTGVDTESDDETFGIAASAVLVSVALALRSSELFAFDRKSGKQSSS